MGSFFLLLRIPALWTTSTSVTSLLCLYVGTWLVGFQSVGRGMTWGQICGGCHQAWFGLFLEPILLVPAISQLGTCCLSCRVHSVSGTSRPQSLAPIAGLQEGSPVSKRELEVI